MADLPPLLQAALQLRAETSISRLFLAAMTDTNRPPLCPAAQAVKDAFDSKWAGTRHQALAAALRAAADQVVPYDPKEAMHFTTEAIRLNRMSVRASFLAIAAELEGSTRDPPEPHDLSHLSD